MGEKDSSRDSLQVTSPDPSSREKRNIDKTDVVEGSSSDEDGFGPSVAGPQQAQPGIKKKRRKVQHEKLYLNNLPNSERYMKSYMHRSPVTVIAVQPEWANSLESGFIVSGSADGYLKFWKKTDQDGEIQFVKQYMAHNEEPIRDAVFSSDGRLIITIAADKTAKVFDVLSFDMITILELPIIPFAVCWLQGRGTSRGYIAISDEQSPKIYIYDIESTSNDQDDNLSSKPIKILDSLHKAPVSILAYNSFYDCVISVDTLGMIEYWQPEGDENEEYSKPDSVFELKSTTNLYDFRKTKTTVSSLTISPDGKKFATMSSNRRIAIFDFQSGKRLREYDESLEAINEMHQFGTSIYRPDDVEFGRRLAVDRELEKNEFYTRRQNVVFDLSSNFIIYATLLGVKVVNIITNSCSLLLGKEENIRFLSLALYQGRRGVGFGGTTNGGGGGGTAPTAGTGSGRGIMTMEMATSANEIISKQLEEDPILFATGFRKSRFYLFTKSDNDYNDSSLKSSRDVQNETIPINKSSSSSSSSAKLLSESNQNSVKSVTLHTSLGDITIKLYPQHAPLAVENFVTHCRKGYYDNLIFHRIIKKFMIQGGDPEGDGTGGVSIWGKSFPDEFTPLLRHDRPFTVSMANAGKNTNGSQFFITTDKTPWLDDKHTIFGRVEAGAETVRRMEALRTDKDDRPEDPPSIVSTTINFN